MAVLVFILWFCLGASPAAAQSATFCVSYQVNYTDADLPGLLGYFAVNGTQPARGALLQLHDLGGGGDVQGYASVSGPDAGCVTLPYDSAKSYDLRIAAKNQVSDGTYTHTLNVRNSATGKTWYGTLQANFTPVGGSTSYTTPVRRWWHVAAAASFALYRHPGATTDTQYNFYTTDSSGTLHGPAGCSGSCVKDNKIYLTDDSARRRYFITFGLGRGILYYLGNQGVPNGSVMVDASVDDPDCSSGHQPFDLNSLEDQSAAAANGFAHAYGALVFYDEQAATCHYVYWNDQNYDLLGYPCFTALESSANHMLDCFTGPSFQYTQSLVREVDNYKGTICEASTPGQATSLDYFRQLMDLMYSIPVPLSFSEVCDIYRSADPSSWGTGQSVRDALHTASGAAPNNFSARWQQAALRHGTNQ